MLAIRRLAPVRSTSSTVALRQVLADNQAVLAASLRAEVAVYESRYGVQSGELSQALADGRLEDTPEICDWFIAWEGLRAAAGATAGSARLG